MVSSSVYHSAMCLLLFYAVLSWLDSVNMRKADLADHFPATERPQRELVFRYMERRIGLSSSSVAPRSDESYH